MSCDLSAPTLFLLLAVKNLFARAAVVADPLAPPFFSLSLSLSSFFPFSLFFARPAEATAGAGSCENCAKRNKALYCTECEIDICITCSTKLHQSKEKRGHRRVALAKKNLLAGGAHSSVPTIHEAVLGAASLSSVNEASSSDEEEVAAARVRRNTQLEQLAPSELPAAPVPNPADVERVRRESQLEALSPSDLPDAPPGPE